jgi:hypothetical protein
VADVQFEIKGDKGSISVKTFRSAIYKAFDLLREFDSALSGKPRGILGWYIYDLRAEGGLMIAVQSRLTDSAIKKRFSDTGIVVARTFVNGFEELEHEATTPPYLSESGMVHAQEMVNLIGKNGAKGFRVSAADKQVDITQATSENIQKLLPIKRTAIGSIEGKIEQISIHKDAKFIVYHAITNKAVTCQFHGDITLERVTRALGKRVHVWGTLLKNFKGETLRIKVEDFRIVGESSLIPKDQTFPEPEFTDADTTAELLRRIRGG